ncbi:MAG TPA: hypothetical protein VMJ73_09955 [Rhizomicrobium sp.]|nr:hypothetical protein [Rhizomicrobium sp.]
MKNFRNAALAAVCAFAVLATASEANARAYKCTARSPVAYGWFISPSLSVARYNALRQCAIRTPRGLVCLIRSCYRV